LSTTGNSAAAATKSAETPTAGGNQDRASVFMVEVIGYGGGDGTGSNPAPAGDTGSAPAQPDTNSQNSNDGQKKGSGP
jgi:hypothetical protein